MDEGATGSQTDGTSITAVEAPHDHRRRHIPPNRVAPFPSIALVFSPFFSSQKPPIAS